MRSILDVIFGSRGSRNSPSATTSSGPGSSRRPAVPDNDLPEASEFRRQIEDRVSKPEQSQALALAHSLVNEYRRRLSEDTEPSARISIRRPEETSWEVRNQAKTILEQRGWNMYTTNGTEFTFGPTDAPYRLPVHAEDLASIASADSVKQDLENIVFGPRRARALHQAKAFIAAYQAALQAGKLTSNSMDLDTEPMDSQLVSDINDVLGEKGWHISNGYSRSDKYTLYPYKRPRGGIII